MRATDFIKENEEPKVLKLRGFSGSKRAQDWIDKIYDLYPHMWQGNHVMSWGQGEEQQFAIFELVPSFSKAGAVEVKWFQAYPLRSGVGTRAMRELQRLAKEDGISLTLYPWDKGQVSQGALTKFYKKQGFKPTSKGSKNMQWEPELDEAISLTNKLDPARGAIRQGIRDAYTATWNYFRDVVGDVVRDDIFDEKLKDILTGYLVRHIKKELLKEFPEISRLDFIPHPQYNGWVARTYMVLNYHFIEKLSSDIREGIQTYLHDNNYASDNETDPRRVDYNLTKMSNTTVDDIFKYSHKSNDIRNDINKMSSTFIHELVHVHQHVKQADREGGSLEYRSYLTKNKKEFYDAVEKLETNYHRKLYSASPQEIPAFAHQAAIDIIETATGESNINEIYNIEYLMNILENISYCVRAINSSRYEQFDTPGNKQQYTVFKRFMKMTYQEVMQFVNRVKQRIEYLKSQPQDELDEDKNPRVIKLRDARRILSDAGYELYRTSEGHEQWKHPDILGSNFTLPVHPSKDLSPNVTKNLYKIASR